MYFMSFVLGKQIADVKTSNGNVNSHSSGDKVVAISYDASVASGYMTCCVFYQRLN